MNKKMNIKIIVTLVSLSLLISACSLTDIIDTALEFVPQTEEALPEIMEQLGEFEDLIPIEETPVDEEPEPDEAQPTEEEMDASQDDDEDLALDITLTERTVMLESDDPPYEIEVRYPYMEGDSDAISPFNAEMDYLVEVVLEVFVGQVEEREAQRPDDAMGGISFLEMDYEVTYQSNGLYSVYLPITTYIVVSTSPWMDSFTYNYDALNQEFLMPGNMFLPDAAYFPVMLDLVEAQLVDSDFGYQEGVAEEVLMRRDNWNVMPDGLRINFDAYEVGPGAAGPQFVFIPWEELSDMLDLDGPAGRILTD